MRLCILHRPSGLTGGDVRIAYEYGQAMQARGADVTIQPADKLDNLDGFDIIQLWAAVSPDWALPAAIAARKIDTAWFVVTPIYWPRDERLKFFNGGSDVVPGYRSSIAAVLDEADILATFTMNELQECWRLQGHQSRGFVMGRGVAPSGLEPSKNGGYVLCLARIEPNKNQHSIALACYLEQIPLILAGPIADENYAQMCANAGATVIGEVDHDEAMHLMQGATCHALPSFCENVSVASCEAWDIGIPAVMSINTAEPEFFGGDAFYCNPSDWRDIARALREAVWMRRSDLAAWIDRPPTWESVADRCYRRFAAWLRE